jgi:hypothetical protein
MLASFMCDAGNSTKGANKLSELTVLSNVNQHDPNMSTWAAAMLAACASRG